MKALLNQTKSELYSALTQQRSVQASLTAEQLKTQLLQNQKNELISEVSFCYLKVFFCAYICCKLGCISSENKVYELNDEASNREKSLKKQVEERDAEIQQLRNNIEETKEQLEAAQK